MQAGQDSMCTMHAVVVLCFLLLARFGESFHAYTRFKRWDGSNSTVYLEKIYSMCGVASNE